jgi:hypothetical protein
VLPFVFFALQAAGSPPLPVTWHDGNMQKLAGSVLIVGPDGLIEKCSPLPRVYQNVEIPPDLCDSFKPGKAYGTPVIYKGHPQRRRVEIKIETYEEAIR